MAELDVQVVASDHAVWSGAAKSVRARTVEGDIGILPGHTPVLSLLAEGELVINPVEGSPVNAKVTGGFFSVDSDQVTIVADEAELTQS
ncbi:F0F1 ATP synthase subunit epsilon [Nesterenkonia sp. LB17]|uniref:F0F1 ATP synthase subunit epsilon n=1 Tax=unclassified Nesterenkonia TaxID=2629769 RepID=UPI001F4CEF38|nr:MULTISPECIES: F0F1 ATP synthase subunit epsilon [unclassified Nesterenkonia]MCH8561144.1 F0F1 ATP synthase subunit epsilon [Nesterenkonia sp. DZ6]MCH8562555.1 F0F1 ATP synthase subunit epsilon [Nesterenkonia sp. YGD6]MCH8565479.1 F0F1 ATP synthase subunit epsilon [Nesterenkonia sp. LB17]MCH8571391.1 F0F1 ATP synthase subunit epsilon [Nesterenkonia sp. AY15]